MRVVSQLKQEIKQQRPFRSLEEEVVLGMMLTVDRLTAPITELLRQQDLGISQYNVLRILRGAGNEGLPSGEIAERMIRRDPDLTRLLDRLESRGVVTRARDASDRRVVRAKITEAGLRLLDSLDHSIDQTVQRILAHVPKQRLRTLSKLLEEARAGQSG
jgi:DNA-binding MarR family transcriptional regulator